MIRLIALNIKGGEEDAYIEAELTERELELLAMKTEIEARVQQLRKQTEEVKSVVHAFTVELKEVHKTEASYLENLQAELRELTNRPMMGQAETDADVEDLMSNEAFRENIERTRQHNEAMSDKKHEKKSAGIKRLFKLIAAKAHPDKTKHSHLHALFIMAREAYDNNDFPKMEKIFKCIVNRTTWAFLRLEEEIEALHEQEALTALEFQTVTGSVMIQALRDYRSGLPWLVMKADNFFVSDLNAQIERTLSQIRMLDPTRYAPQVQQSSDLEQMVMSFFIGKNNGGF